ncbi:flagellar basal body-associated FliL family protein [Chachezhania antarctica]|uniref:flagellar basal body-associated FliL family protein n=1 Tax=Chachezhania antarctica TaxID=2340860 RepID=UPI000EAF543C|nr:flagellar basal body-associated FliL family protein [Chachezhania antarctica]|tara:strand:+ start:15713 stop:16216 length:504 start_codon:yes stop_codon:yes gene_type:complete
MSDATADMEDPSEEKGKKPGKMRFVIWIVLALVGAGGGFFATQMGLIPGGSSDHAEEVTEVDHGEDLSGIAFVELEPIVISVVDNGRSRHLRFRGQLEVPMEAKGDVEKVMPRVIDVLNGYLRALEVGDLEHPMVLPRMRAQMLRRIQIVVGRERVRDLLIMDFVLS